MAAMRDLGILMLVVAGAVVALSPRHRALVARKLEESRRFMSRRIVDRDARDRDASRDRWNDDGGAMGGTSDATIR